MAERDRSDWLRVLWASRGHILRAWLWFLGSLAVLIQILIWARPFTDGPFSAGIARLTAATLRIFGNEATTKGTFVYSSIGAVEIVRECTGVYPTALYISAVLAHHATWRRKLLGVGFGIVAIQAVNLVRVVSLIYVRRWYPDLYETSHLVVWQSLIVFFIALLWIVWAVELSGQRRAT